MSDTETSADLLSPDAEAFAPLPSGITLCYTVIGPADGIPVILTSGLGEDWTAWPVSFVQGLLDHGLRVIRFDNRDAGRSSTIGTPPPTRLQQFRGKARPDAYSLEDMAGDAVALLDHLGIDRAHVVGRSMGGMIAQTVASTFPDRVLTLTSISSTTGNKKVGGSTFQVKLKMTGKPAKTVEEFLDGYVELVGLLGGPGFPYDEALERRHGRIAWERARGGSGADGMARQIQAIAASGDRTTRLQNITAPALIINGDHDLIVHPSGGKATAAAIRDARHIVIPGMGHHLAPGLIPQVIEHIVEHIRQERPA